MIKPVYYSILLGCLYHTEEGKKTHLDIASPGAKQYMYF